MMLGDAHFAYPANHIEADNRLSWFLGRLDRHFGDEAFYVHLTRDDEGTAKSFVNRYASGIIVGYRRYLLMGIGNKGDPMEVSRDYCDTVNANIRLFLKDKSKRMNFRLENAKEDFKKFWEMVGAEGDLDAALAEFDVPHNASKKRRFGEVLIARIRGKI